MAVWFCLISLTAPVDGDRRSNGFSLACPQLLLLALFYCTQAVSFFPAPTPSLCCKVGGLGKNSHATEIAKERYYKLSAICV